MRALLRTALADLRRNRLQSALIVLMLVAAAAALTLTVTVRRGMDAPYERAFAQANGAHIWFFGRDTSVDWTPVASMEGVTGTSGPFTATSLPITGRGPDGRTFREELLLRGMPAELPAVGHPIVLEGRWLRDGGAGEIVIDRNYATRRNIRVGDRVQLLTAHDARTLEVVGLSLDIGRGPFPLWDPALSYVLPETLTALEPNAQRVRSVFGVRLAGPAASERFTQRAFGLYPPETLTGTDDWHEVRADIVEANDIYTVLLGVFSVFALGACGFVIANAISGRVLAQFREIGVLKAIGFTPGQVIARFLAEHLLLALASTLAGIAIAAALAPRFLDSTAELFNTTAVSAFAPSVALLVLLGVATCVALFTLLPAWQAGRIPVVRAITVGFARVQRRPSRLARLAARLRLPAPVVLGLKDAFARPVRALLTVAALALTVMTAVFSLGMEVTLRDLADDPAFFKDPFAMDVFRGNRSDEAMRAFLAGMPGVSGVYARSEFRVLAPGRADSIEARALDEPYDQFGFRLREGRYFSAPGEAVAGHGLLSLLDLKVGDELRLLLDNRPLTLRVVGRYNEGDEDGRTVMFSLETLRRQVDPGALPSVYGLRLIPGADREAVRTAIQTAPNAPAGNAGPMALYEDDAGDEVNLIRGILLGLNGVLLLIGLVNLLTTALLGVRERVCDIGIFKAIGLTPGQVVLTVVGGAGLLATLAALAGIPLGLGVTRLLFDQLGRQTGVGDVGTMPSLVLLLPLIPATVLLAALASALPARRAAGVQVAEALRYE